MTAVKILHHLYSRIINYYDVSEEELVRGRRGERETERGGEKGE